MSALPSTQKRPTLKLLEGNFTMVPNSILIDASLSINARLLYTILLHHNTTENGCFPGHDRLAAEMGLSRFSVMRAIEELSARGIVKTVRRGQRQTNVYILNLDVAPMQLQSWGDVAPMQHSDVAPMQHKQEETNKKERTTHVVPKIEPSRTVPDDFEVSIEMGQWAESLGFSRERIKRETEKFRLTTFSKAHTNWNQTWRKWFLQPWMKPEKRPLTEYEKVNGRVHV